MDVRTYTLVWRPRTQRATFLKPDRCRQELGGGSKQIRSRTAMYLLSHLHPAILESEALID